MAASNLGVVRAGTPSHFVRNEKTGVDGVTGLDIVAQVVLAGIHKRVYLGVQSLVLTSTAQGLTIPAGTPAALADIYNETGSPTTDFARYWHGATPTAAVGKKLSDDQELQSASPSDFLALNGVGANTLRIEYWSNG